MNSNENTDVIIEISDVNREQQLQKSLLPLPLFQKFHSSAEPHRNDLKNRGNSLPEEKSDFDISKSSEFKLIWILSHLSKMQLDMNRCYLILETTNLEDDIQMETLLNNILNQYFSDQVFQEEVENDGSQIKRSSKYKLISKIFNKNKEHHEQKIDNKANFIIPIKEIKEEEIKEEEVAVNIDAEVKNCQICYQLFQEDPLLLNQIPHQFCTACLISYVEQKVFTNQVLSIKCPCDCGKIYTDENVKLIFTTKPDIFTKYLKFKRITEISQDPNVRWCVRAECEGYMTGEKTSKKLICPLCTQEMCFLCRNAWHEGQTCEQAMNLEFKKYVERVEVKACPKCKSKIEKSEGCNHMTCSRCHYQFCWLCLGKYGSRHYEWYNIFGCSGMQYSKLRISWKSAYLLRLLKFLMYLVLGALIVAVGLAVSPIVILMMAIYLPYHAFYEDWKPNGSCKKIIYKIVFALGVIIFLPIELVLATIPGTCLLAVYVMNYDDDD